MGGTASAIELALMERFSGMFNINDREIRRGCHSADLIADIFFIFRFLIEEALSW